MCTSGCPTPGAHETYGECLRGKSIQIDRFSLSANQQAERAKDHTLKRFRDLAASGITAQSPLKKDVEAAEKAANSA